MNNCTKGLDFQLVYCLGSYKLVSKICEIEFISKQCASSAQQCTSWKLLEMNHFRAVRARACKLLACLGENVLLPWHIPRMFMMLTIVPSYSKIAIRHHRGSGTLLEKGVLKCHEKCLNNLSGKKIGSQNMKSP